MHARQGYAKLYFYENNEVWFEFIIPGKKTPGSGQVCFRKMLFGGQPSENDLPESYEQEPLPDSVTVTASHACAAGGFWEIFDLTPLPEKHGKRLSKSLFLTSAKNSAT